MTLQELKDRKRELGYTNEMIAYATGVPLGTVQKIFAGTTKSPRWTTIQALENLLSKREGSIVREEAAAYGHVTQEEQHTLEEYLALPNDRRVEMIDGVFYDLASALPVHQAILRELFYQFYQCMERHPECELFMAPMDVRLGTDGRTVVQPDLFVFCNRKEKNSNYLSGAPDFVLEILSPSNRNHDLFRKLNKYRFAGVREYWIVDPRDRKLILYDLEHDTAPETRPFAGKIPIGISQGKCKIDLDRVNEKVKAYY